MRHIVLLSAFAVVAATGSMAQAGDWYRCMFGGGPFSGYCDGGVASGCAAGSGLMNYSCGDCYGCVGCNAGMNGGFYNCTRLNAHCANWRYTRGTGCCPPPVDICCPSLGASCGGRVASTCCAPATSTCCVTVDSGCCSAAPSCCAPVVPAP